MRNYVKPECDLIALNMSENIAASAQQKNFNSKSTVKSDETGTYVSNSQVLWSTFATATALMSNIMMGGWLLAALSGDEGLFADLEANCIIYS